MTETVSAFIIHWFLAHGYPVYQARAIDHVAFIETRHDYCIIAPEGFRGAFQWDHRRWATRFGSQSRCPRLESQLQLVDQELRQTFPCFFKTRTEAQAFRVFRATFSAGRPC